MAQAFPTPFGKYILLKPLARGGMGEIFLALTGELGGLEKLCVIKRVRASTHSDSAVGRFLDEAKVVIKLSHGNLVQVFDAGFVDDEIYLAMEYVEGRDLRELLVQSEERRTRVPTEVALYIATQICRGLDYAHGYGNLKLVHRDICPSNVLVSYTGEVKVTDFGLAQSKLKQEHTEPGKVFGRFSYLAPEQARREEVDHRTDLYSTTIILWELLTGEQMRPGPHTDPGLALARVRSGKITPPSARNPRIPAELDVLVVKGLQLDRERRYESAEEMRRAIAKVLSRMSPTFDAGGVAAYMRQLYGAAVDEERAERERLLAQNYDRWRRPSTMLRSDGRGSFAPGPAGAAPLSARVSSAMRASQAGQPRPVSGRRPGEPENLAGQIVDGRYRVLRLIGEGGMGGVYEAEHTEIGRRVALKILHAIFSSHPETVARFRAEARAATRIGHPNIVEVTDSGTTEDGRVYFVMELLSGVDLARVMADDRIVPAARALHVTAQICRALHAAHEAGIVHRDLKPENIFLTLRDGPDGPQPDFVKILDFGIAKNVELGETDDRLTHPGIAMGTPEYMAPEQAAGKEVDRRIDVYATGALLYEMLTGHLPHEGENLMQILSKKASHPPAPPRTFRPDLPERLEQVILRSLAGDPTQRYQTMAELADALQEFIAVHGNWELTEELSLPPGPSLPARSLTGPRAVGQGGSGAMQITIAPTRSGSVPVAGRGRGNGSAPTARGAREEAAEPRRARSGATKDGDSVPAAAGFDPTLPSPGLLEPARTVVPGEVRIADDVQSEMITRLPVGPPAERLTQGLASTQALPVLGGGRRWLLYGGGTLALVVAGVLVAVLWPRGGALVARPPDARVAIAPAPRPDARVTVVKLKPATRPAAKLTAEEVDRLLEWAKSAAAGGRFIAPPKGDNVRELLDRVEEHHPEHPGAVALRQQICQRLRITAGKAVRKKQYAVAEKKLEAWMMLEPLSQRPRQQLLAVYLVQGKQALAKNRVKPALNYAKTALGLAPGHAAALELRADVALKKRQFAIAVKDYELALEGTGANKALKRRVQQKLKAARKKVR